MKSKSKKRSKVEKLGKTSEKNETVLLKSSLSQTRKIIADKLTKLRKNKVSSERKSNEKYSSLSDSLKKLIAQKGEKNQNQQVNRINAANLIDLNERIDIDDDDGPPPPQYPPPQLPPVPPLPLNRNRLPIQHVRPLPPLPTRPEKTAKIRIKRPHSMVSQNDNDDNNIFESKQHRKSAKLPRQSYDSMEFGNDNFINDQIDMNEDEDPEAGAWSGVRANTNQLQSNNRFNDNDGDDNDDDDAYVEILNNSSAPKSNGFIAKALNIYKRNGTLSDVLPDVQFAKIERRRKRNKKNHTDDIHPNLYVDKILQELNEKKADALNEDIWNDKDEEKYKAVSAILSPDDFDDDGKFIGSAQKRRKIALAASKFNINTIKHIKFKQKKGGGLEKNFIPYSENIVYEYWDDPNELCERLKLLLASKGGGNSNHDQEINSIIEELRERKIIV